jgi:hypothetical protein
MTQKVTYEYADGSANLYLMTKQELRYVPVTPEQSSTGMYSGGEPKTVPISTDQFNALKGLLDNALDNTSIHISDRIKTSGMISRIGSTIEQCMIIPYCKEMMEIEETLKRTLNK